MKKGLIAIIISLIGFAVPLNVFANNNSHINKLTDKQYYNLKRIGLDDVDINSIDENLLNIYKNVTDYKQTIITKYFKDVAINTSNFLSRIEHINVEISEDEYNKQEKSLLKGLHETSYKKLELQMTATDNFHPILLVSKLKWKKLPNTKSYDVFGLLGDNAVINNATAVQIMTERAPSEVNNCMIGELVEHTTNYNSTNYNGWNYYNPISGQTNFALGVGISMGFNKNVTPCIYDLGTVVGVIKGYEFRMYAGISINGNNPKITSSYQHAQSNVSFSDSMNYSFSKKGLGEIFKFNNATISKKYDNMAGVTDNVPRK